MAKVSREVRSRLYRNSNVECRIANVGIADVGPSSCFGKPRPPRVGRPLTVAGRSGLVLPCRRPAVPFGPRICPFTPTFGPDAEESGPGRDPGTITERAPTGYDCARGCHTVSAGVEPAGAAPCRIVVGACLVVPSASRYGGLFEHAIVDNESGPSTRPSAGRRSTTSPRPAEVRGLHLPTRTAARDPARSSRRTASVHGQDVSEHGYVKDVYWSDVELY